jgi:hypothetical protein
MNVTTSMADSFPARGINSVQSKIGGHGLTGQLLLAC